LLRQLGEAPGEYELLEKEVITAMLLAPQQRQAFLRALERSMQNVDLPVALRETLARAKQGVESAVEEDLLTRQ
jgi:heme oxygenase